ncbi:MAG: ABC transporter ATP-binding protein [Myxococcota bacterium]
MTSDSVQHAEPAITLQGLNKQFQDTYAVKDVSFQVQRGEIFGFMGHNGAGKTTTIRMLLGLLQPTSGSARVLGLDIEKQSLEIRRRCGFLPASYALPGDMTPHTFLLYIASMFGLSAQQAQPKIQHLLELFHMSDVAHKKLKGFSTGMTQKIGLAQALINDPEVLFLDEPTAGLDPIGRNDFLQHIQSLAQQQNVTVMFSTHILSDIESICEHVAILHRGALLAEGSLKDLRQQHDAAHMDDLYLQLVQGAA